MVNAYEYFEYTYFKDFKVSIIHFSIKRPFLFLE